MVKTKGFPYFINSFSRDGRIIGGKVRVHFKKISTKKDFPSKPAGLDSVPYQLSFRIWDSEENKIWPHPFCGAVILNTTHGLSSGSCCVYGLKLYKESIRRLRPIVGAAENSDDKIVHKVVTNVRRPSQFDNETHTYDIWYVLHNCCFLVLLSPLNLLF